MHALIHCTRHYHVGREIGGGLVRGVESRTGAIREKKKVLRICTNNVIPLLHSRIVVRGQCFSRRCHPLPASGGLFILFSSRCGYVLQYYKYSAHYILHTVATRKYTHIPLTPPTSEARAYHTHAIYYYDVCVKSPLERGVTDSLEKRRPSKR